MFACLRVIAAAAALGGLTAAAGAAPSVQPSKALSIGLSDKSATRAVVALKAGGALYVFAEGDDILARPVTAGFKAQPTKSLTTSGRSPFGISEAAMAQLANGNVAVAWAGQPGPRASVFARVIKPNGDAVSSEIPVSNETFASMASISVSALSGGGFAISWIAYPDSGPKTLNARAFTASGVGVGTPAKIAAPAKGSFAGLASAPIDSGFLLVYSRRGASPGIMAQRFSSLAQTVGAPVRLDRGNDLAHETPQIVRRRAGGYAVVWHENAYGNVGQLPILVNSTLKGRFLNPAGAPTGRFSAEDPIKTKSIERTAVLTDTKAGILLAWRSDAPKGADDTSRDVRGALVSYSGVTGAVTRFTRTSAANEFLPFLATMADGRVALGFSSSTDDGDADPHGAFASVLTVSP